MMAQMYEEVARRYCTVRAPVGNSSLSLLSPNDTGPFVLLYSYNCMDSLYKVFVEKISETGITPVQYWLFSVAYAILTVLGLTGNGLIILAILRKHSLRRSRNFLIANMALSNFLLSSILYPLLWLPDSARHFSFGRLACKTGAAFPASNIYCSTLSIAALAVERYHSIRKRGLPSLRGPNGRETLVFLALCLLIWLVALLLSTPYLFFYDIADYPESLARVPLLAGGFGRFCLSFCQLAPRHSQQSYSRLSMAINILQSAFLYIIPSLTVVFFNYRLSRYVSKNTVHSANELRTPSTRTKSRKNTQQDPEESTCYANDTSTTSPNIHSTDNTRHLLPALNDITVRNTRRRSRLRRLLASMALSYAILWLPYTVYVFMLDFGLIQGSAVSTWIDFTVKYISVLSVCVNPIIYGYLNKNLRPEIMELFLLFVPHPLKRRFCPAPGMPEPRRQTVSEFSLRKSVPLRVASYEGRGYQACESNPPPLIPSDSRRRMTLPASSPASATDLAHHDTPEIFL